jgi:short-chain fatty acids transporter
LNASSGPIARAALALTQWSERWVPDAFVFALAGTFIAFVAALIVTPSTLGQTVDAWGRGFWDLIPFTLQMSLVIITGHVLATSPPMTRLIRAIAGWPRTPRGAVALVAFFAMASSWLNWGFSLVFSAVLALELARRIKGIDYRALAAASFLGLGSIWAQGLSGSAALQMATPGALPPAIRDIVANGGAVAGGIIPFRHTIFLWQSVASVAVELVVVTVVMWLATPAPGDARTADSLGIDLHNHAATEPNVEARTPNSPERPSPGQFLERSPALTILVGLLGLGFLVRYFASADDPLNAITLNTVNMAFLLVGFVLHGTPARLMRERLCASRRRRRFRRSSRCTLLSSASSFRQAGRNGSSRRRT